MKQIFKFFYQRLLVLSFVAIFVLPSKATTLLTESFTSPYFPTETWTNGSFALSSGTWDSQYAMGLTALNSYNGSGYAVKLNRYLESYLTTPALNSVGTISFYYRNFSSAVGGGTFKLQKSVNNGTFTDLATVTFTTKEVYTFYSFSINDASSNIRLRIYCPTTNTGYLCIDEISVTDIGQTLAANPSALTGINYYLGAGPSTSQSFNLMGSNLTGFPGNIAIAAPTNYEVSINNTSFSSAVNVPYTAATLSAPVYVRLKSGLALGNYNSELVNISGGGAPSFTVACSGSVTNPPPATINVTAASLSGFTYVFGAGPSVAQSYTISATNLTGYPDSILVTAPADYQLSLDYSTYSSTLKIPYTASTLSSVVVYVRLKSGLAVNSYNSETITNVGGGASTNVTCNGSVSAPPSAVISASTSTLSGFSYVSGSGPSTVQSFNLNGANLTGYTSNITVTAPSNYEVCLTNNGTFTPSVLVAYTSATLASTPIYVRLKAGLAVGTYNSAVLQITGGGDADGTSLTCSGSVVVTPTITVSVTALDFEKVYTGYHSLPKKYTVTGSNLTQNITITAPTGIEITTTCGTGYTNSVSLVPASGSVSGTIYARYTGGVVSGNITHTHTGATTKNISVSEAATATNLPGTYYSTATGTGATLKTSLYNIIKTHTSVSYDNLWTAYATTDLKPNGKIWDMYSDGDGCATPTYEFTYDTGQCGSYVNEGDCYNREHSFPKSWFNDATPMYTDLFHIVPTDGKVNGMRSNYPFGVVTSPTYTSTSNGSKLGANTYGGTYTGLAFEPNDAYKGDFARNYLYMATCYETVIGSWESNDVSGDAMLDGLSYPCFEPWALQMLLEWNAADPVDQKEKSRNDAVYTVQGNRNPFIDNPSYVNLIWGSTPALSVTPSALSGFTYSVGNGPSTAQTFVLSGANLTGFTANITISAPANFEVSTDGTSFAASKTVAYTSATLSNTTIYVRLTTGLTANSYSGNITISGGGDSDGVLVSVSGSVTAISATLTATPSTLSGFGYVVGSGPSTEQSFSLTGANLTGYTSNITLVAPSNFELSLTSGGTFSGTISVPYTSATLATTSIFVRLASGLTTGAYTGNITISGGGDADGTSVSLSANITANDTSGCLSENFSGFTTGTHAVPGTTDVASSVNTYTHTTGWAGVKIFPAGGEIKLGSSSAAGSITTPTVNLVTGASVSFDIQLYGTDAGVVQVFHAPDGVTFSQVGTDITPTSLYSTKTVLITDGTSLSKIRIGTSQKRVYLDNISVDCGSTTPTPTLSVIPASLTGFTYVTGAGPSTQQSYSVSGTNLNGSNVTITPSTNYEISQTSGTGFGSTPIILTSFNGSSTTIYVRLKAGLAVGTYNSEVITNAGGGATTVNVTCSGDVTSAPTPIITVNPTTLTGFTYVTGAGPSAQQSYAVSGTNLNGSNVTITPSTNYEISQTSGTGFGSTPIVLTAFSGTSTTIYVRLKAGLAVGTYNSEIITNAGGGATTVNVTCSGDVTSAPTPIITVNPTTLTGFTYVAGAGPSAQQSYSVSGTNLNGSNVTITPSTNYEISQTSGTGFGSTPIVLTAFNGTSTTIYVRLKSGLAVGTYNSEIIANAGGGATTVNVTCSGDVTSAPTPIITVNPTTLTGFTYITGAGPSAQQSYAVSGTNLNGSNVTITPSTNYEISQTSGTGFGSTPIVLTAFNGTSTTIYVRLKSGLAVGTYNSEIITNAGGGATTVNVTCSGDVTSAPTPIITVNPTSLTGFTYVAGAGPSAQQSYAVSGTNLNGSNVTITPSTNYEISQTSGTGFGSTPIVLTSFNGTSTTIYVRLKAGLAVGTYNSEIITNAGGGATTVNVTCSGNVADDVSVEEQTSGIWANVFPNPFSETLTIQLLENTNQSYTIQDALGRIVFSGTSEKASKYVLNTESLAPGLYILKITSEGSEKVAKLVKR